MEVRLNCLILFTCLFGLNKFHSIVATRLPAISASVSPSSPSTTTAAAATATTTATAAVSTTNSLTTPPETTTGYMTEEEGVMEQYDNTHEDGVDGQTNRDRLEQSRLLRIKFLKQHMLASLGWTAPPQIDSETKKRLLQNLKNPVYVMKQKFCYHPVCDLPMVELPDYINRSLWFDTSSKNIRFFFQISSSDDPNLDITSAYVKLHLKRREDCLCAFGDDPITSRIHIKIYQYRKPIRSHSRLRHSNMRLIDAKMVTWDTSRWVTLQVTDAIRRIVSRGRRNGGFEVRIRDMEENVLDAKTIIDPTVCTSSLEYQCNEAKSPDEDVEESENPPIDPDFSPVLEVSSTTTSRIELAYP